MHWLISKFLAEKYNNKFLTFLSYANDFLAYSLFKVSKNVWVVNGTEFAYRRQITVTEQSGNNLSYYQILIELNSTNFDFSHTNSDGSDVRFYDGSNFLDYWIEKWDSSNQEAKIWIKVPSIPASSSTSFYMYYGNPNIVSASNGKDTFEFFDNFEGISAEKWEKYSNNPILAPSESYDSEKLSDPWVIYDSNDGIYRMWYSGSDGTHTQICYATSTDGKNWTKYSGNPILEVGPSGSYDDKYAHKACVVYKDGVYYLFYSAQQEGGPRTIALATATNPEGPYTKYENNPILTPTESWEGDFLDCPCVMYDEEEGIWKMWYSAGETDPSSKEPKYWCYATSTDGKNWTKYSENPIASPPNDGSWQSKGLGGCCVLKINGKYYNYHNGFDDNNVSRIGYATSSDGISWDLEASKGVILDLGPSGSWDDYQVYRPNVIIIGNEKKLYYNASDGSTERIGLASFVGYEQKLDSEKWVVDYSCAEGNVFIEEGLLTIDATGAGNQNKKTVHSKSYQVPVNVVIETRFQEKVVHDTTYGQSIIAGEIDVYCFHNDTQNAQFIFSGEGSNRVIKHQSKKDGTWGTEDTIWNSTPELTHWYRAKWVKKETSQSWYFLDDNGTVLGSLENNTDPPQGSTSYSLALGASGMRSSWDWILVRKYVEPEPSVSIGEEEAP